MSNGVGYRFCMYACGIVTQTCMTLQQHQHRELKQACLFSVSFLSFSTLTFMSNLHCVIVQRCGIYQRVPFSPILFG